MVDFEASSPPRPYGYDNNNNKQELNKSNVPFVVCCI